MTRPKDAPIRSVFALCHAFQDDYQSSCGLTTAGIIAYLGAKCTEIDHVPAAAPFGIPATMLYIRNCAGKIRRETKNGHAGRVTLPGILLFYGGDHAVDAVLDLTKVVYGHAVSGGDFGGG